MPSPDIRHRSSASSGAAGSRRQSLLSSLTSHEQHLLELQVGDLHYNRQQHQLEQVLSSSLADVIQDLNQCSPQQAAERSKSQRQAQMELFDPTGRRMTRRSLVDLRGEAHHQFHPHPESDVTTAAVDHEEVEGVDMEMEKEQEASLPLPNEESTLLLSPQYLLSPGRRHRGRKSLSRYCDPLTSAATQVPAIAVTGLLILMTALPFGVAYFPIGWTNDLESDSGGADTADIHGPFPLPGKEALGIRMCLFATLIGQLTMTFTSGFTNLVTFQLVENVPFYHALAATVIHEQGYGKDALATLFFLFGLSSVLAGAVFYILGKAELGRIVYFFPSHVLVGLIGGIGIFIMTTAVSVTNNEDFALNIVGIRSFVDNINHFGIVIVLEIVLRILMWILQDKAGQPRYPLVAPIFFVAVVPLFYLALYLLGVDVETAESAGYMFPSAVGVACDPTMEDECDVVDSAVIFDGHVLDIFRIIDFQLVSWKAVFNSVGTITSMTFFTLLQSPINVPAFAVSADCEVDMNQELYGHRFLMFLGHVRHCMTAVLTHACALFPAGLHMAIATYSLVFLEVYKLS